MEKRLLKRSTEICHEAFFDKDKQLVKSDFSYNCFIMGEYGNRVNHTKRNAEPFQLLDHGAICHYFLKSFQIFLDSLGQTVNQCENVLNSIRSERSITHEGVIWDVSSLPKLNMINQMMKDE